MQWPSEGWSGTSGLTRPQLRSEDHPPAQSQTRGKNTELGPSDRYGDAKDHMSSLQAGVIHYL